MPARWEYGIVWWDVPGQVWRASTPQAILASGEFLSVMNHVGDDGWDLAGVEAGHVGVDASELPHEVPTQYFIKRER